MAQCVNVLSSSSSNSPDASATVPRIDSVKLKMKVITILFVFPGSHTFIWVYPLMLEAPGSTQEKTTG